MRAARSCIALALLLFALTACATAIHPGAVNKFDSDAWDSLVVAQTVIEQAKLEPVITGNASSKAALNKAIAAYNVAEDAWQAWHATARAMQQGGVRQVLEDPAELQRQLALLAADILNLKTWMKGGTS